MEGKGSTSSFSRPSATEAAADAIPILIDDVYHLFHLATPPNTVHHPPRLRSSWHRLRSTNLVDWKRDALPSITPGPEDDTSHPASSGAWTGSAVTGPDGRLHVFYTGYNLAQGGKQVILHSVASDREGSFFPSPPQPLRFSPTSPAPGERFSAIDFRDAYVFFNQVEASYWMLVATKLADESIEPSWARGCLALLTSPDLETWTLEPEPFYHPQDMLCPECPELFSLPSPSGDSTRWYLVYSRFHAPHAGTVYRVSDTGPRGPFRIPRDGSGGRFDGRRGYAAKSCPLKSGSEGGPGRAFFGWVADREDPSEGGKWLWGGDMGIPRAVRADDDGSLQVAAAVSVEALEASGRLHQAAESFVSVSSVGSSTDEVWLKPESGAPTEGQDFVVVIKIHALDAASFGVLLRPDSHGNAYRLNFAHAGRSGWTATFLDREIPLDDFWADQYEMHLPRGVDGPEILRHEGLEKPSVITVFVRGDVVECFFAGRSASFRLLRAEESTRQFDMFVQDGHIELEVTEYQGTVL